MYTCIQAHTYLHIPLHHMKSIIDTHDGSSTRPTVIIYASLHDCTQAVRAIHEHFPGWSQAQTHQLRVDGLTMLERVKAAKKASKSARLGTHFWMELRSMYTITDMSLGALQVKDKDELVPPELIKALEQASTANVGTRTPRDTHKSFTFTTCCSH